MIREYQIMAVMEVALWFLLQKFNHKISNNYELMFLIMVYIKSPIKAHSRQIDTHNSMCNHKCIDLVYFCIVVGRGGE